MTKQNAIATIEAPPQTLREAIVQSRLTHAEIIAKVGCTKKSLSNWRNGKRPSDYYIGRLSDVLGINLWPLFEDKGKLQTNTSAPEPLLALRLPPLSSITTPRNLSLVESSHATTPRAAIDQAMRVYVGEQLSQLWDKFHLTEEEGGITTLRIALMSHHQMLKGLAELSTTQQDQHWLVQQLCETAILEGRIARDQLDYHAAIVQHKHALELALECASANHVAAAAMRLSETLWEAGLPFEALSYCQAGIDQSSQANPRVRGELLGFATQVYASLGHLRESERLVNEAATLAVEAVKLPTAGGINFSRTAAAEYQSNEALRRGDTRAALEHIQRARQTLSTEFPLGHNVRWEAHLWIDEARVHGSLGDVEAACDNLRRAARLAQSIASHIGMRKVQEEVLTLAQKQKQSRAIATLRDELISLVAPRTA